jgi:hypothetical protein
MIDDFPAPVRSMTTINLIEILQRRFFPRFSAFSDTDFYLFLPSFFSCWLTSAVATALMRYTSDFHCWMGELIVPWALSSLVEIVCISPQRKPYKYIVNITGSVKPPYLRQDTSSPQWIHALGDMYVTWYSKVTGDWPRKKEPTIERGDTNDME